MKLVKTLLTARLLLSAAPAWSDALPIYKASAVEGLVLGRTANASKWSAVHPGSRLVEGQLVQITAGATITIESQVDQRPGSLHADRLQLTLRQPMIARVSADLLRRVRLNTFFVDKPAVDTKPAVLPAPAALSLKDAWERLTAVITRIPPVDKPPAEMTTLEREGISLALSAKRLRILTPTSNALLQANDWPADLKVVWTRAPEAGRRYLVYAWDAGTPRAAPQAETGADFHTVKLHRPGTYFVQVTTTDGVWQSPAVVVHGVIPAKDLAPAQKLPDGALAQVVNGLPLKYPQDRFVLAPKSAAASIPFAWSPEAPWDDAVFVLSVRDKQGRVVGEVHTRSHQANLQLHPGAYTWSVALSGSGLQSERRQLEVLDPAALKTGGDRLRLLDRVIDGRQSAVLSLDDGF